MAFTYGITLNLEHRRCIVVGGGAVAERKVLSLLDAQADITVISPVLTDGLAQISDQFHWIARKYKDGDLAEAMLVIAATDSREVNHAIAVYCEEKHILVNVIDNKEESSFTVNAMVKRGDLLVTISTGGASPAMAKSIKEKVESLFGIEYEQALNILKKARKEALQTIPNAEKRRACLQQLGNMPLVDLLQEESMEEVEKRVRKCLSLYWD